MTNEECAKALEDIQRRAVSHRHTGSPMQNLAAKTDPETRKALGFYVPERKPARPAPAPAAVR
jgi:hypothetical protein